MRFGALNAIAFVLCILASIVQLTAGEYTFVILNLIMAAVNFKFAMQWLHSVVFK